MKTPVFKDRVKVYLTAGNGGDGFVSFRREKYVPRGGPDGGDGGHGGSVYLQADEQTNSLLDLYFRPHQRADHGGRGRSKNCHGKNGKDLYVRVPCGTIAYEQGTEYLLGEVLEQGKTLLIAKGGVGGLGNTRFAGATNQAPTEFKPGTAGEQRIAWLELKTIADIGLVGFPNAGKSTLLSKLTNAQPKIKPYPFTTLNPIIGTLENEYYEKLRIADIPG